MRAGLTSWSSHRLGHSKTEGLTSNGAVSSGTNTAVDTVDRFEEVGKGLDRARRVV